MMTARPPVSGEPPDRPSTAEPRTEAGRELDSYMRAVWPEADSDLYRTLILDIEAEASDTAVSEATLEAIRLHRETRATPTALDVEALQEAMAEAGLGVPITEALRALHDAYYAIPTGEPTTEQVMEKLPDLYSAIQRVLDDSERIAGLLATVDRAERHGLTIHVATRRTCAEHIEAGDDKDHRAGRPTDDRCP